MRTNQEINGMKNQPYPHCNIGRKRYQRFTFDMVSHISFAETWFSPERPKTGKTVTLTFWVSQAAIEKVTGGLSFAVLQHTPACHHADEQHNAKEFIKLMSLFESRGFGTHLWCKSTPDTPSSPLITVTRSYNWVSMFQRANRHTKVY